jgi:cell division protein FtsQ
VSDPTRQARADPRITRRRKAIERSRKKRLIGSAIIVALTVVIAWAAFWSPLLNVKAVRVSGSKHVSAVDIQRVAGIGKNTNLLLLSTSRVVDRIETLPWVREARVKRSLPGILRVRIVERRPALVLTAASSRWLIDPAGHVIAPAHRLTKHLPTLAAVHQPAIKPGMRLTSAAGAGALAAWRAMPPTLSRRVVALYAPTVDAITFSLRDGTTIRYGPPEGVKDKNRVLLALLHKVFVETGRASYIDVRVPTSPAVAPASPAKGSARTTASGPATTPSPSAAATPAATPSATPTR